MDNGQHILQNVYRPLQPTVGDDSDSKMRYKEFAPSALLKPYIHCYWTLWSGSPFHSPFTYQIVSDGCIDLFLDCHKFEGLLVAGTAQSSTSVLLGGQVEYFGIRFLPGCFHCFFPQPLKELANQMILCQEVWGNRLAELEARLFSAGTHQERVEICESYLLRQLTTNKHLPDVRFWAALKGMYQQRGQTSIESNPDSGISPRQLRRLFDRYIGVSPKSFARIVRFQSLLRAMLREPKKAWGALYFDFGYYDQAHLIHEFKHFFGQSPSSVHFLKK